VDLDLGLDGTKIKTVKMNLKDLRLVEGDLNKDQIKYYNMIKTKDSELSIKNQK